MWLRRKKQNIYETLFIALLIVLITISVVIVLILVVVRNDGTSEYSDTIPHIPAIEPPVIEKTEEQEEPVEPDPLFDVVQLQSTVDQWEESVSGTASVVVMDGSGVELASINKDQQYFAASIYKLYVAYFGYQQVDNGEADPAEPYVGSQTRAMCLDLMIRESDSPCAEKMWAELGKQSLTDQLVSLGITNTSMTNLRTTAYDAALLLSRIARQDGLSAVSQQAFLDSAENQIYRDALNKGFSTNVTVYNKIGFRDFDEYHDTAIIELADGRQFILSVLTDGVGTSNIANLGTQVESLLQ